MSKSQNLNLLIVEDDPQLASSLKLIAPDYFKVYLAQKPSLVPTHVFFHAAMVDLHLEVTPPGNADGLKVIQTLTKRNPQTDIIAMSGNLSRDLMEKSIQAGAQRFLAKPLSAEEVSTLLEKIQAYWNLRFISFEQQEKNKSYLIGKSAETENLRKRIAELRGEKSPILVEGETGVGKDVVSRILNQQETTRPYVSVNCSALNENLFESEFFGHIKGAFTGAESNKTGFAEAAHGGDLFLDEIETLPLTQQAKLLRFLESGEIRKVGAKDTQVVDVRVIVASNIPLKQMVAEKKFREDLYFRLSSHRIEIQPLRQRTDDIEPLTQFFLELEKPRRNKTFDPEAILSLKQYSWPGNIRELKRVCEQLVLVSPLPVIRASDVNQLLLKTDSTGLTNFNLNQSLEKFLTSQEKQFIQHCLEQTKDLDQACDVLKISKSNLYKKIKDLNITYE